tara:strand:- start:610 stop:2418 length:1809 start_codon:yes stop_codon:yes gene_type:complete
MDKNKIETYGKIIQKIMVGLFTSVIKSDLRLLQYRIRADEYMRLRFAIRFATQHSVMTPILTRAVFLLEEDIAPYTKHVWFSGPVRSAVDVLTEIIDGLEEMLEGFENRKGQLNHHLNAHELRQMNKSLVEVKITHNNMLNQRNDMLQVIQANQISPHQLLFLSKDFKQRFFECHAYNRGTINLITSEFDVSDDYWDLFRNITTYFIFADYSELYSVYTEAGLHLQGFKNDLTTIMDGDKVKAVYMDMHIDGEFYDTMNSLNEESYDRQLTRHRDLKALQNKLYVRYIADLIQTNAPVIRDFYAKNPTLEMGLLLRKASDKLKDFIVDSLSRYIQPRLGTIFHRNAEQINLLTSHETHDVYILKSPINGLLKEIEHNGISFTNTMSLVKNNFMPNLKRALRKYPELKDIMTPPAMQRMFDQQRFARERQEATESALEETDRMDVDDDTAAGFVNTMNMEFRDIRDKFQGTRKEHEIIAQITGQYILTQNSYLQYQVSFPVIQIEKRMTGDIIVGLNESAFRLGFRINFFIVSINEANSQDTHEFLEKAGLEAGAGANPKRTLFKMVALGQKMVDKETDEELLEEVLNDETEMFGKDFFKNLF